MYSPVDKPRLFRSMVLLQALLRNSLYLHFVAQLLEARGEKKPRPGDVQVKVIEPRYIDGPKLMALLARRREAWS